MEKQLLQVLEFQKAFNVECKDKPEMLDKKRARLRQRLLQEEVGELAQAKTILDVSDAMIDVMYILLGSAHEYGIADRMEMLFNEIHESNMSKLGIDGKPRFRKDGKVMKQKGYRRPKLKPILERDFTVYKNSEVMKELAEIEADFMEKKVMKIIASNLNFFDRIKFKLNLFLERGLQKKVKITFPKRAGDNLAVHVYGKRYYVSNS